MNQLKFTSCIYIKDVNTIRLRIEMFTSLHVHKLETGTNSERPTGWRYARIIQSHHTIRGTPPGKHEF